MRHAYLLWNVACRVCQRRAAVSFLPWMIKVLLSVRKPTLLIRPCHTTRSDTLLVTSMYVAEICTLVLDVRSTGWCQHGLQKDFFLLLTGICELLVRTCLQCGAGEAGKKLRVPSENIFILSISQLFHCSPHGLLPWLAEINAVNSFDGRAFYDLHIFKRIKHNQQFSMGTRPF